MLNYCTLLFFDGLSIFANILKDGQEKVATATVDNKLLHSLKFQEKIHVKD